MFYFFGCPVDFKFLLHILYVPNLFTCTAVWFDAIQAREVGNGADYTEDTCYYEKKSLVLLLACWIHSFLQMLEYFTVCYSLYCNALNWPVWKYYCRWNCKYFMILYYHFLSRFFLHYDLWIWNPFCYKLCA